MKTFLCSHLVTIRWNAGETCANLERISRDVATLNAEQPIPVGLAVEIDVQDCALKGTVTRCLMEMSGYEMDVALEEEWSTETFVPDHLFDPDVMIAPNRSSL